MLNLLICLLFLIRLVLSSISLNSVRDSFWKSFFKLPFVSSNVDQEVIKMKDSINKEFPDDCKAQLKEIPYKTPDIKIGDLCDEESLQGKLSGTRYPMRAHSDFVMNLSKKFSLSNPLHLDSFPFVKQMEVEVISMCAKMLNFTNEKGQAVGSLNGGGTESILLSILAYREYKFK
jgi:hypothetical protein